MSHRPRLSVERMSADRSGKSAAPRPARVCFMIDRLAVGGSERQVLALIRSLDRAKVLPHLVLMDGESDESRSLEPECCPVLRLGVRSVLRPSSVWKALRLARFLNQNGIDIVETHFPASTYFGVPLARLSGVRWVVSARRSLDYWMTPVDRRIRRLCNRLLDYTVTNCQAVRREVITRERVRPESVMVMYNGIDPALFDGIPPLSPMDSRPIRKVGMLANLRPVKGIEVFVRAAAIVASQLPETVFEIAGAGDEAFVRGLAEECRIKDHVKLLGGVTDIPSFLAGLDVAVITSYSEGLSNALLEYMAAGRAIVATTVGGNLELIESGVHGLLVPAGNPEATASAIDRLLCDLALAARLGAAAKRRALRQFSLQSSVRRAETLYWSLVHGGG